MNVKKLSALILPYTSGVVCARLIDKGGIYIGPASVIQEGAQEKKTSTLDLKWSWMRRVRPAYNERARDKGRETLYVSIPDALENYISVSYFRVRAATVHASKWNEPYVFVSFATDAGELSLSKDPIFMSTLEILEAERRELEVLQKTRMFA